MLTYSDITSNENTRRFISLATPENYGTSRALFQVCRQVRAAPTAGAPLIQQDTLEVHHDYQGFRQFLV